MYLHHWDFQTAPMFQWVLLSAHLLINIIQPWIMLLFPDILNLNCIYYLLHCKISNSTHLIFLSPTLSNNFYIIYTLFYYWKNILFYILFSDLNIIWSSKTKNFSFVYWSFIKSGQNHSLLHIVKQNYVHSTFCSPSLPTSHFTSRPFSVLWLLTWHKIKPIPFFPCRTRGQCKF